MTEEHLQEDQRREAAARIGAVEWHPPLFHNCQAPALEDHAQAATIEIQLDFSCMSHNRRSRQPFFPRIAQRDGRRTKPELMSKSCSELGVPPVREGRNSEMESKKGRREEEWRNSQQKKP